MNDKIIGSNASINMAVKVCFLGIIKIFQNVFWVKFLPSMLSVSLLLTWGWPGVAKVSCILCHRGVQLILAYS